MYNDFVWRGTRPHFPESESLSLNIARTTRTRPTQARRRAARVPAGTAGSAHAAGRRVSGRALRVSRRGRAGRRMCAVAHRVLGATDVTSTCWSRATTAYGLGGRAGSGCSSPCAHCTVMTTQPDRRASPCLPWQAPIEQISESGEIVQFRKSMPAAGSKCDA